MHHMIGLYLRVGGELGLGSGGVPADQGTVARLCGRESKDRPVLQKPFTRGVIKVPLDTLGHPEPWSPVGT